MLGRPVDVLPYVLLPLAGPEEFTEEEMEGESKERKDDTFGGREDNQINTIIILDQLGVRIDQYKYTYTIDMIAVTEREREKEKRDNL